MHTHEDILTALCRTIDRMDTPQALITAGLGFSRDRPLRGLLGMGAMPGPNIMAYVNRIPVRVNFMPMNTGRLLLERSPHIVVGMSPPQIYLPTLEWFQDDSTAMHAFLHETAHWVHFYQLGFLGKLCNSATASYAEIVADTAAMITKTRLGIAELSQESLYRTASYVKFHMQQAGQWLPSALDEAMTVAGAMEQVFPKWEDAA